MIFWRPLFALIFCFLAAGCGESASKAPQNGPAPKAFIKEDSYDVGTVVVGQKVSRDFTVKNVGEAPLVLGNWTPTDNFRRCEAFCQIENPTIPPGGSTKVTVTIVPGEPTTSLHKGVSVETNEGEGMKIRLGFHAVVEDVLEFHTPIPVLNKEKPEWRFETGVGGEPEPFLATLYSVTLKDWEIEGFETGPEFRSTAVKLKLEDMAEFGGKYGYRITTQFVRTDYVGPVHRRWTVKTNAPNAERKSVELFAVRWGPVRLLPQASSGWRWDERTAALDLGLFPAETGKQAKAYLFINNGQSPDWKVESIDCDVPEVAWELAPLPKRSTPERRCYELTLEISPATKAAVHTRQNAANLVIHTNHPQAKLIRWPIQFVSTPKRD